MPVKEAPPSGRYLIAVALAFTVWVVVALIMIAAIGGPH